MGDGNDTITLAGGSSYNTIDGGAGTNTVNNNSNANNNIIINATNYPNGDVINFTQNETKQIQIGDKSYTVVNNTSSSNTLTWSTDENGQITFDGGHFTITAADGQEDNIVVDGYNNIINTGDMSDTVILNGYHGYINTGDGNDTVTIASSSYNNTIDGGTGKDTLINNSGNSSNTITNFELPLNSANGTYSFDANESQQIQIGDKAYTVSNNRSSSNTLTWSTDENGQITFDGNSFTINAAAGQEDNIVVDGYNNIINTGDMDDTVTLASGSSYNTIDGGDGTDTLINYGKNNKVNNVENANTLSFTKNETKQIQIGDKYYTVSNNRSSSNTLTWSIDDNGQITFDGGDFSITAASGQEDNIIVNGHNITLNTSDQNDTVTLASSSYNNTIDGGTGTNTVTNNSSSSNTIFNATDYPDGITLGKNETQLIQIGDKYYTVTNKASYSNTLTWSTDENGQITFDGGDFSITAASGQEDNIIVDGNYNIINTGDLNDTVVLANGSHSNTIDGGIGKDTLINNSGYTNTITNFELPLNSANGTYSFDANESQQIQIGDKSYTVVNNTSSSNTLTWTIDDNGQITFDGSSFTITAVSGQEDNIIVDGNYNIINTGDMDDTVIWNGYQGSLNTGDGNDSVTLENGSFYNTIDGGAGTNTVTDNSGSNSNIIINATNYPDGEVINFTQNETKQIQIGDKSYTVVNNTSSSNTLTWTIDDNGQITFDGDYFTITAASGQEDNIIVDGSWNNVNTGDLNDTVIWDNYKGSLNTGDGDDTITISNSWRSTINTGAGNDTVTITSGSYYNTIDGGAGSNTLIDNSGNSSNTTTNFGSPTEGSITINKGDSSTIDIDGKKYTITSTYNSSESSQPQLSWSLNKDTGEITFTGTNVTITAADGQEDNIIIEGMHINIYTGDMNDKVTIGNTMLSSIGIWTGDGNDTIINNNDFENNYIEIHGGAGNDIITNNGNASALYGEDDEDTIINNDFVFHDIHGGAGNDIITNSGTVSRIYGEAGDDTITNNGTVNSIIDGGDGNDTITNNQLISSGLHIYGGAGNDNIINNGTVHILDGDAGDDTITNNGTVNYAIYGGDGNDTITNNQLSPGLHIGLQIYGGAGNDKIYNYTDDVTINGEDGNDTIINTGGGVSINGGEGNDNITSNHIVNGAHIYGGNGDDKITINANHAEVYGEAGDDSIYISGDQNVVKGGSDDDYVAVISGKNNTISGGTGYDKISNNGTDTTYSQMNELVDKNSSFNIQIDGNLSNNSTFNISTGLVLPDITIDVSTRESALEALDKIDAIMLNLTSSRVDIGFQKNMLNSIMETNLTRLTNLSNSQSTLIDADIAAEYNNLLTQASKIQAAQLLQTQLMQNQASVFLSLINSIAS